MNQGAKSIVQDPPDMRVSHRIALLMFILPWGPHLMGYIIAPGFLMPFFNHPVAQKMMIGLFIWQVLCCLLAARTNNRVLQFVLAAVSAPPVVLAPMLGPAVVTIWAAITGGP